MAQAEKDGAIFGKEFSGEREARCDGEDARGLSNRMAAGLVRRRSTGISDYRKRQVGSEKSDQFDRGEHFVRSAA